MGTDLSHPPRYARPRLHRQPYRTRHAVAQARRVCWRRRPRRCRCRRADHRRAGQGHRSDPEKRRAGSRRCRDRRRRRVLAHQTGAQDRLRVQRLRGGRDPLRDGHHPRRLRQFRHLPQAEVPRRPAARLRLGVPDGRRPRECGPGIRHQLQGLAVHQRHPVPRQLPPLPSAGVGTASHRGAQEKQKRAGLAAADGFHRVATLASGRAVHR